MSIRGFRYPLEPLRQQAGWQLDAAQTALAEAARALQAARADQARHQHHVTALLDYLRPPSALAMNPALARNRVAYVAQAAERTRTLAETVERAEQAHAEQQDNCRSLQLKLDAIEQHHRDALGDHHAEAQRKAALTADDDWLVRSRWTARSSTGRSPEDCPS